MSVHTAAQHSAVLGSVCVLLYVSTAKPKTPDSLHGICNSGPFRSHAWAYGEAHHSYKYRREDARPDCDILMADQGSITVAFFGEWLS